MEPLLSFYRSVQNLGGEISETEESFILKDLTIIKKVVNFVSMLYNDPINKEYRQKISQKIKQQNEKELKEIRELEKSEIFSLFSSAIICTIGYLIPEESRRTFSKHLRYVLEETDLCRYGWKNNSTINQEEENIYHFYYEAGEWKKWEDLPCVFNLDKNLLFKEHKTTQKLMSKLIEKG